jgi:hypothetical protein
MTDNPMDLHDLLQRQFYSLFLFHIKYVCEVPEIKVNDDQYNSDYFVANCIYIN